MANVEDDPSNGDAPERLPTGSEVKPEDSMPAAEDSGGSEDVPVEDSLAEEAVAEEAFADEAFAKEAFARDVSGAQDFSEKALSERTRKAYRRAWSDFRQYCERIGKDALPARPVTVAAYVNNRE